MSAGVEVVTHAQHLGFSSAVNLGLKSLRDNDHVLIANDDTIPLSAAWHETVVRHLDDGLTSKKCGAVGPMSNYALPHQTGWPQAKISLSPVLSFFWVAIHADALASVGGLDEDFDPAYSEDVDWCLRARELEWDLILDHTLLVWHWGGQTTHRLPDVDWNSVKARNEALVQLKHRQAFAEEQLNASPTA